MTDKAYPHYLLYSEWQLLNEWCKQVRWMFRDFDNVGLFMVGSVLTKRDYRDVDIRLMLADQAFVDHFPKSYRDYLSLSVSLWGQKATGLPIDFQVQQMFSANEQHKGKRNAIGVPV